MSEATEAIIDIKEALEEYGTDIILKKVEQGAYDPISGETPKTITQYPMKAFLPKKASSNLINNSEIITSSSYDVLFQLYHSEKIKDDWIITYDGSDYEILMTDSIVLQNETLMYEVVAKK